jgi:hypothetical protein
MVTLSLLYSRVVFLRFAHDFILQLFQLWRNVPSIFRLSRLIVFWDLLWKLYATDPTGQEFPVEEHNIKS